MDEKTIEFVDIVKSEETGEIVSGKVKESKLFDVQVYKDRLSDLTQRSEQLGYEKARVDAEIESIQALLEQA